MSLDQHPFLAPLSRKARRFFGSWWRRQSPARQDRYATIGPLVAVLLFLAAIVLAFWYLRVEEMAREDDAVRRDVEKALEQISRRNAENRSHIERLVRDVAMRAVGPQEFEGLAQRFVNERSEIISLRWYAKDESERAGAVALAYTDNAPRTPGEAPVPAPAMILPDTEAHASFAAARTLLRPHYSHAYRTPQGIHAFQVTYPIQDRSGFNGALVVEYAVESLLRNFVSKDLAGRHTISLIDSDDNVLATTGVMVNVRRKPSIVHETVFELEPHLNDQQLFLRAHGYRTSLGLIENRLFWMVVALSGLTVWMLWGTWRHLQRRLQAQAALGQETNFRRAMENSMLTGMRAMDLEGRITYVNPAFCAMTGFSEAELLGRKPPFPHWPPDRIEENSRLFEQELQGRSPAGGIEVKVLRKDGSLFDARMYVSPLIDAKGQQSGWMTSMTNITEAKRIRDQLAASHERFTTVLEGLDAAVSVLGVQYGELLFANRSYRLWFGSKAEGHLSLAGQQATEVDVSLPSVDDIDDLGGLPTQELTDANTEIREVYVEDLDKWFDVRARYLQWTDGRLAQMLVATDVTARRRAEDLAAQQAEKAQAASRLITMGEMASSVAHELNQPLTAISTYCAGMISRLQSGRLSPEDMLSALEKTAKQAQRAGQIIHRIRNFVKRSEPQRQGVAAQELVDDAVELASIELRRRSVQLQSYVAQHIPMLQADPILVVQVLVNLLKNAAEAIDNAGMQSSRRHIDLRVLPRHLAEGSVIEFSVSDTGPGVKEEVINKLFDAFFSTKSEGMGIGLNLCRSIIESHQGRIRVENLYNGSEISGCRFSFTLPVHVTIPQDTTEPGSHSRQDSNERHSEAEQTS